MQIKRCDWCAKEIRGSSLQVAIVYSVEPSIIFRCADLYPKPADFCGRKCLYRYYAPKKKKEK
jgi:ribosomal protein L40E